MTTEPFWHDDERGLTLRLGDCVPLMAAMDENSVDAICCDPPYGLNFMNAKWDAPWKYGMSNFGFKDDKFRNVAPSFSSSRNPMCRACHKHKRGSKNHIPCSCSAPDFDDVEHRLADVAKLQAWHHRWAVEALRVLKPGGYLLAAGGSRTFHRLVCALEDAGFEIRDTIVHIFGTGFPKSLSVSVAIDREAGAEREVVGIKQYSGGPAGNHNNAGATLDTWRERHSDHIGKLTAPATEAAKRWNGWHTALKPAAEYWTLARKPLSEPTVAANVLRWGTGALNIDASRVGTGDDLNGGTYRCVQKNKSQVAGAWQNHDRTEGKGSGLKRGIGVFEQPKGRWPANLILSYPESQYALRADVTLAELQRVVAHLKAGSLDAVTEEAMGGMPAELRALFVEAPNPGRDAVLSLFPETGPSKAAMRGTQGMDPFNYGRGRNPNTDGIRGHNDNGGSAARFFYVAKSSKADRGGYTRSAAPLFGEAEEVFVNTHPTVKPLTLIKFLCRLVTPPGGLILDPFLGSGTTLVAAKELGFSCIGIEQNEGYCTIAVERMK